LRRASLVAAILLACSVFLLIRTGGMTGDADSDLHWRWTKTPEERLLAQAGRAFADQTATALPAVCGSRPTGLGKRRSQCGASRSDLVGRPSPSATIFSTRRNN